MSEVPLYLAIASTARIVRAEARVDTRRLYRNIHTGSPAPSNTYILQQTWDGFHSPYRGTSPIRKRTLLGPYRRPMPRVLGGS